MDESKNSVKPWERPWNTDEMRQQSANWNLAGDAGLLRHLQQFSQTLLARTHATEVALDSLVEQLKATSTDVSNVTNQFLCLANTQFLENRVYDDDEKETPPEEKKEEAKPKSKEEQEAEVVTRVREALALGMSVLDNMFDTVEVPASDSEDEDEESSGGRVVLEPHNPYLSRPLPYLIGSRQFMEDDHVGLGFPSDSEEYGADKNLIQSSESESEMDIEQKNIPKKTTRLSSTSASENSDFDGTDSGSGGGPLPSKQKKVESSGLFDSIPTTDTGNMFGGDSPMEDVAVVENDAGIRDNFAAELAAKLGGVAAATGTSIQTAPKPRTAASKPTLEWGEEDDNGLFGQRDGKFSGGQGLFDDLEDSPGGLWATKDKLTVDKGVKKPSSEASLFGHDTENEDYIFSGVVRTETNEKTKHHLSIASTGIATSTPETNTDVLGPGFLDLPKDSEISDIKKSPMFAGPDFDDGDLFTVPKPTPRETVQVTVDQQPDSIKKKKPAGAVSIFGSVDVFKAGIRRPPSSSSCSSNGSASVLDQGQIFNTEDTSSGIGKSSGEQQDSTKSQGASAASNGKVSLFGGSDNLFDPVLTSAGVNKNERNVPKAASSEAVTSDFFQDDVTGDSLFSKPTKGLTHGSGKSATAGGSTSRLGTTSRKPVSLFNDSDSGDEELLFSSTSSTSSRSRRSQGSGDLLAAQGDKGRPTTIPKKGLFDNEEDIFGGTKDEPGFDIFNTGAKNMVKANPLPEGNVVDDDLISGRLNDPEFNLFKPSNTSTSVPTTTREKLKNGGKDTLFNDDDSFGIFGAKPAKSIAQVSISSKSSLKDGEYIKPSSVGLFSDNDTEDIFDDMFAVPISKSQSVHSPSKVTLMDSLFSKGSVLEASLDDLFASPVQQKEESQDILKADRFLVQTDDIFSIPRTLNSSLIASNNKVVSKENSASKSESVSTSENVRNDILAKVPSETSSIGSSGLFSDLVDEGGSDLFIRSTASSTNKKPLIANKPVISPKPKLSSVSKPLKDSAGESDSFSSIKINSDNILQHSIHANAKERSDILADKSISASDTITSSSQTSSKSEQKIEIHASPVNIDVTGSAEKVTAKEPPPVLPSKLEPPKTLNIRKTTSLLFSSSSNEDEDLFGMSFPGKVSLDLNSTEVIDQKPTNSLSDLPQSSSADVEKPTAFSTEKRSKSEKEISSKMDSSQESRSSTMKARSVGASPRQFNIDPMALLPGARPSPRGHHNTEAAVSFDCPAQPNATLHSAGKDRARIQARRRPPTRRARQEAVRTSGIDFEGVKTTSVMGESLVTEEVPSPGLDEVDDTHEPSAQAAANPDTGSQLHPPGIVGSQSKPHSSSFLDGGNNLLSPSTDEEDLFGVPQDLPSEYGIGKDDGQSLFSCAPVLSPLESLPKFPMESTSTKSTTIYTGDKTNRNGTLHTIKLLEDSLDEDPTAPDSHISSDKNSMHVPNLGNDNPDKHVTRPSLEVLHDSLRNCEGAGDSNDLFSESKMTLPSTRREKQDLFDTVKNPESFFTLIKPIPKVDINNYLAGKPAGILSNPAEDAGPSLKDYVSSKNPLSVDDERKPGLENIPQSNAQEELFKTGSEKRSDDLFTSRKSSGGRGDDLFIATKTDNFIHGDVGGDLFSSGIKTSLNKEHKNRTYVDKSDKTKDICDVEDNTFFSSRGKQKQSLPSEEDLFSNTIKDVNTQKLTASEKNSLFGGDSPESDDLFFAASTKKKLGNSVTRMKPSGTVASSIKGSLFDEDEGDDIFGSIKSASKSGISTKPVSVPSDNTDELFASGSAKKKLQPKEKKPTGFSSSRHTMPEEDDMFEDPLMVVTKK